MTLEVDAGPIKHERGPFPLWFDRELGPEAEAVVRRVLSDWGYVHPTSEVTAIRVDETGYTILDIDGIPA